MGVLVEEGFDGLVLIFVWVERLGKDTPLAGLGDD